MRTRIIAVGVVLTGSLAAQGREWIGASFVSDDLEKIFAQHERTFQATWTWPLSSASHSGQVTMPFDNAGAVALIEPNTFLVAGKNMGTNQAWLTEVTMNQSGSTVAPSLNTMSIAMDLTRLVYDGEAGLLFGLNQASSSIVVASYMVGGGLGPWQTAADPSNCPLLGVIPPSYLRMELLAEGGPGLRLSGESPFVARESKLTLTNGAWSWTLPQVTLPVVPPRWFCESTPEVTADEAHYRFRIGGGTGLFGIVDEVTQQVVFVATHGGGLPDEPFDVPIASVGYGRTYKVISLGGQGVAESVFLRVEQEWRRATAIPAGFLSGRVSMRWDFPSVGTDVMSWSLYWAGTSPRPQGVFFASIILGSWNYNQTPTTPTNGLEILTNQYGVFPAMIGSWDQDRIDVAYVFNANNPALVGSRVAIQAIGVAPDQSLFVSDVRGVILR
jgi:hypothetical protein